MVYLSVSTHLPNAPGAVTIQISAWVVLKLITNRIWHLAKDTRMRKMLLEETKLRDYAETPDQAERECENASFCGSNTKINLFTVIFKKVMLYLRLLLLPFFAFFSSLLSFLIC